VSSELAGAEKASAPDPPSDSPLRITVDPRVELLSLIFRLAGNPEYNQARVASYAADADKQFKGLRDHPVIKLARELRKDHGVSYDACMSLAVHLTDDYDPQLILPLEPWPEGLDRRWPPREVSRFLVAARQFVRDSSFKQFIEQHRELYETTESRLRALMEKEAHLDWFNQFYGEHPQAAFTVALGMLNGGCCYGPHCRDAAGREELFCVLGVWKTDREGLPTFDREMLGTVVHEFSHSYANPIIDRHKTELAPAGKKLYAPVSAQMRSQAYGEPLTMLRESLVRACGVRYQRQYGGEQAARKAIAYEKSRGFLWTEELSNLLGEYEAQRDRYPTLEAFAPRLVSFFNEYAKGFGEQQALLAAKRPKVVSMTPANGARNVDPGLKAITVVFDRTMKNSWAMVGGGPHYPETTGKPHYDAKRTTWTVPVKLKPDWSYEFRLNFGGYDAFRSEDDVPLEPVLVTFTTGKEAKQASP
jgi:hypothetical protein